MTIYTYTVSVTTGNRLYADTINYIYITLIGTSGESGKEKLDSFFALGSIRNYPIHCNVKLGDIVLIRLEKGKYLFEDNWFCSEVTVEEDCSGKKYCFPCYTWLAGDMCLELREGEAKKINEDTLDILKDNRQHELDRQRGQLSWMTYGGGLPKCVAITDPSKLPPEMTFLFTRNTEFMFTGAQAIASLKMLECCDCSDTWRSMKHIEKYFNVFKTNVSACVHDHWEEDDFFGYQYLNGTNPILIKQCKQIPANFPVTNHMVSGFLESNSLQEEMEKGNIFLVDYQLLEDVPANIINGHTQYIPAPLCLLYKDPHNKLKPIAIQLKQTEDLENPIFLPNDNEEDWLLAKIYVRSADFNYFELVTHLLRTHLMAEVFCMATFRELPSVHPLCKLLTPHMRYTLQINIMARNQLLGPGGIFDKGFSTGGKGKLIVLQKAQASLTYSSLCLPDDITARGLQDIPGYYYRDDGLKLWAAISGFVKGLLHHYYPNDSDVCEDTELQSWIKAIFFEGFQGRKESGIPDSFSTVNDLNKFLTMVLFTCSAQHNAVNNGQFDFCAWMPNACPTLRHPPPTKKGETTRADILESIADINSTVSSLAAVWLLTRPSSDFVKLGCYPEKRFTEKEPTDLISEFQKALDTIDNEIVHRNEGIEKEYIYMRPSLMENSVAI